MSVDYVNPPNLFRSDHFNQLVRISGEEILLLSGQVALDSEGKLIGKGNLRAQTIQVFENLKALLAAIGGSFSNLVKLNIFVVNYQPDNLAILLEVQKQYLDPSHLPASTLLGVQSLARPDLLIEIEAMAVMC